MQPVHLSLADALGQWLAPCKLLTHLCAAGALAGWRCRWPSGLTHTIPQIVWERVACWNGRSSPLPSVLRPSLGRPFHPGARRIWRSVSSPHWCQSSPELLEEEGQFLLCSAPCCCGYPSRTAFLISLGVRFLVPSAL